MAGDSTFACMTRRQAMARVGAGGNLSYQIDSLLRMIYIDLNVFLLSVPYEAGASSYQNIDLYGPGQSAVIHLGHNACMTCCACCGGRDEMAL
ncbi:hypothetical protein [Comamonas testosteroni]|uniref:hypothetical protein n=1 Tax=Comamonas testosteroni TaxID=285 RepID=UPI0025F51348|nr:hypothetical protein [Comamonas testosteroni]MEB5963549.1 hypothetical protein [Comamonas testosteroni]